MVWMAVEAWWTRTVHGPEVRCLCSGWLWKRFGRELCTARKEFWTRTVHGPEVRCLCSGWLWKRFGRELCMDRRSGACGLVRVGSRWLRRHRGREDVDQSLCSSEWRQGAPARPRPTTSKLPSKVQPPSHPSIMTSHRSTPTPADPPPALLVRCEAVSLSDVVVSSSSARYIKATLNL